MISQEPKAQSKSPENPGTSENIARGEHSRGIKLPTAVVPMLIFSLATAAVVTGQRYFSDIPASRQVIEIKQNTEELSERASHATDPLHGLSQEEVASLISLADEIESQLYLSKRELSPAHPAAQAFERLKANQQWRIASLLLESLMTREDYVLAEKFIRLLSESTIELAGLEFELALIALKNGHRDESIERFERLLKREPANVAASINLAGLLFKQKKYSKAESIVNQALHYARGVKRSKLLTLKSDIAFQENQFQQALEAITRAIELRPSTAHLWRRKGAIELQLADYSAALQSLEKALALDKQSVRNRRLAARIQTALFQYLTAYKNWKSLHRRFPGNQVYAENMLGNLWFSGRKSILQRRAQSLSQSSTTTPRLVIAGALLDFADKRWREGQVKLKKTLKKGRDNALAYLLIGESYLALNKPKNALVYIEKVSPDNPWYHTAKLLHLRALGRMERRGAPVKNNSETLQNIIEEVPLTWMGLSQATEILEELYQYKAGATGLKFIQALQPQLKANRRVRLTEAKFYWQKGQKTVAVEKLKQLVEAEPNWPAALYRLASYQRRLGHLANADAIYHRLMAIEPDYSDARWQSARTKVLLGEKAEAADLLREFTASHPAHLDARLLLAETECEINHIQACRTQLDLLVRIAPNHQRTRTLLKQYRQNQKTL